MSRPTLDRLAELETLAPDEDCPPEARFSVPASDLRALLALIPIARAAEQLYEATSYTLSRAQTDPDLGYLLGPGMQAFCLLCKGEAAYLGKPLKEVEDRRRRDLQPEHCKRQPEVIELRERLRAVEDGRA